LIATRRGPSLPPPSYTPHHCFTSIYPLALGPTDSKQIHSFPVYRCCYCDYPRRDEQAELTLVAG